MTHYDVQYSGGLEDQANRNKAIADIKEYLSDKQWQVIMEATKSPLVTCEQLDFMLHFTGVQGFPVHALIRQFRPEQYKAWYESLPD